jgi:large subunit ribosomal protein L30
MIGITLTRSPIGRSYKQKDIVRGLGLKKLNQTVIRKDTPEIRGMVAKILHLVVVQEMQKK